MCEKSKEKIDIATTLYMIFLGVLLVSQIYPFLFTVIPLVEIIVHGILVIYLVFRFYMLLRLKNRAIELDLTLTEFLQERAVCHSDKLKDSTCEGCEECEGWDDWG